MKNIYFGFVLCIIFSIQVRAQQWENNTLIAPKSTNAYLVNAVNINSVFPCKDYAMLDFSTFNKDAEVILYNTLGEPVKKYSIGNSTKLKLEKANLTSGICYLIATSGGSVYVKSSLFFNKKAMTCSV